VTVTAEAPADLAPPNDNLAESITLGAMMLSPAIADAIMEILTAADFYRPVHGTIFDAIVRLSMASQPIDGATVSVELDRTGDLVRVGGVPYLHTLIESTPTAANGPWYANRVYDMATRRRIGEAGLKATMLARGPGDLPEIKEQAQEAMYAATTAENERAPLVSIGDLTAPAIERIEALSRGEVEPGIPTGMVDLDRMLGGLRPGQLVIPAGRTSMGKSVITQNFLINCVRETQRPTVLFSVEMSIEEMMTRILCQVARIPLHILISGKISDEDRTRLHRAEELVAAWPLFLVDTVRTVPAIRSYLRRFRQKMGDLAMFGVDYLQELSPATGNGRRLDRHLEVGEWARDLKHIAQDTHSVCVAPCQLNRGPETRAGKDANRPRLADLRESGNLEQSADVAILLFRPGYYDKQSPRAGEADLIVAKNRNGPTDTVTVADQMHLMKFVDMAIA
jgi:replicative DNA helicase